MAIAAGWRCSLPPSPKNATGPRQSPLDVEAWAAKWQLESTLVAFAAGDIVGSLSFEVSRFGFGEIGMAVAREWRGRGVGSALLSTAIDWAREHGLHKLSLSVFPHNAAAICSTRRSASLMKGGASSTTGGRAVNFGMRSRWVYCSNPQ